MTVENITLTAPTREISFAMSFDPWSIADQNTRIALQMNGGAEPEVVHAMLRILRAGDICVDGGANIGFFTLLMAAMVGETGRVYAVEPGPNNLPKLEVNVALNRAAQVQIIPKLLGAESGMGKMWLCEDGGLNSVAHNPRSMSEIDVPVISLVDISESAPRLVKLDCEGSEGNILSSAGIVGIPFIICELNEEALVAHGSSSDAIWRTMRSCGYELFLLPCDGSLPVLVPPKTRLLPRGYAAFNVMFSTLDWVGEVWSEVQA